MSTLMASISTTYQYQFNKYILRIAESVVSDQGIPLLLLAWAK